MKAKCAALLVSVLLLGATNAGAATAPITYAVSEFDQNSDFSAGSAVGGSITTDGTLGPIGAANILDWDLITSAYRIPTLGAAPLLTAFFDFNPQNSVISNAVNITATANALRLGLALPPPAVVPNGDLLFTVPETGVTISLEFAALSPGGFDQLNFVICDLECATGTNPSTLTFADGKVIPEAATATPLPAALPLFAGGVSAMGLFAWRRRRKAQAVA